MVFPAEIIIMPKKTSLISNKKDKNSIASSIKSDINYIWIIEENKHKI